jgi:hypothetical protein
MAPTSRPCWEGTLDQGRFAPCISHLPLSATIYPPTTLTSMSEVEVALTPAVRIGPCRCISGSEHRRHLGRAHGRVSPAPATDRWTVGLLGHSGRLIAARALPPASTSGEVAGSSGFVAARLQLVGPARGTCAGDNGLCLSPPGGALKEVPLGRADVLRYDPSSRLLRLRRS